MHWRWTCCWLGIAAPGLADGLTFLESRKDIRCGPNQASVTAEFPFKNTSEKAIVVKRYDAACTCIGVELAGGKRRYEPGESGVFKATFDVASAAGPMEKQVTAWLEGDPDDKPSVRLNLNILVPQGLKLDPQTLLWTPGSKAEPRTMKITVDEDTPVHLVSVTCSNPLFQHALKTVKDGSEYELTVTPTDTASPALAVFRIQTDSKSERHRVKQAYAMIRPAAEGTPQKKP